MGVVKFLQNLTPLGRWVVTGVLLALLLAGFLLVLAWRGQATAKVEARLANNQAQAALDSGADAVSAVGAVGAAEIRIDVITRENERAIRTAPGADAPVDPAIHAAGIASLCRRAANRGRAECMQQPPAD